MSIERIAMDISKHFEGLTIVKPANSSKILHCTSQLRPMPSSEIGPNDIIEVSHPLSGDAVAPFEYESRSMTFKELCEAIARQLKLNGDIPYGDE